jgi:hypothetical protein
MCSVESDVDSVVFPDSGDSSATPASPSIAIVPPWPKVSTPSCSSRRFLSVLPFPCEFGGHSHLIPVFSFSLCLCSGQPPWKSSRALFSPMRVPTLGLCSAHPSASPARRPSRLLVTWRPRRVVRQEPEPHVAAAVFLPPAEIRPPPPVPTAGEHTSEIPSTSSFRSEPRPSPRPPPPLAIGTARSTCTLLSLEVEHDKVVFCLGPCVSFNLYHVFLCLGSFQEPPYKNPTFHT